MFFLGLRIPLLNMLFLIHMPHLLPCLDNLVKSSNCMVHNSNCLIEKIFHTFEDTSSLYFSKKRNQEIVNHYFENPVRSSCLCQSDLVKMTTLDSSYYPRNILSVECDASKCPADHTCRHKTHKIILLQLLTENSSPDPKADPHIPDSLKNHHWQAIPYDVNVACVCEPSNQ